MEIKAVEFWNQNREVGVRRWYESVRDGLGGWLERIYVEKPLQGLPLSLVFVQDCNEIVSAWIKTFPIWTA